MQLVIGLGNPGKRYALTRHNIGSRCVEDLAGRLNLSFSQDHSLYRAAVGEGPAGVVTLMLPQTYMNRSGAALAAWMKDTGYSVSCPMGQEGDDSSTVLPVVVCDDLNLGLGSLRIRGRGGDGGQKGLASLLRVVQSEELPRMRLGISPPGDAVPPQDWSTYVLQKFEPHEEKSVEEVIGYGVEALSCLLDHGWETAAARFNRRI